MQKLIVATLIALFGVGPSLRAQDSSATGKWDLNWIGRNGQHREATASFTQDGSKLSGTVAIAGRSVPLSGTITGTITGTKLSFVAHGQGSRSFSFSGTMQGDTIRGQTQLGSDWTGTRQSRSP